MKLKEDHCNDPVLLLKSVPDNWTMVLAQCAKLTLKAFYQAASEKLLNKQSTVLSDRHLHYKMSQIVQLQHELHYGQSPVCCPPKKTNKMG